MSLDHTLNAFTNSAFFNNDLRLILFWKNEINSKVQSKLAEGVKGAREKDKK